MKNLLNTDRLDQVPLHRRFRENRQNIKEISTVTFNNDGTNIVSGGKVRSHVTTCILNSETGNIIQKWDSYGSYISDIGINHDNSIIIIDPIF